MQQVKSQRVKVERGFWANVIAKGFVECYPGDVVEVSVADATMVVAAKKGEFVGAEVALNKQTSYLPERKKNPKPTQQDLLASLVKATEANTQAIQALLAHVGKEAKKG